MFYLDIIKYFIGPKYFEGLAIVPIIMAAEFCSGVFFNLSLWYKLTDKTQWGMYFSFVGLFLILSINMIFVPSYGYIASAWAAFCCYAVIMLLSYFMGQKYYPIKYELKSIAGYLFLAVILLVLGLGIEIDDFMLRMGYRTLLIVIYICYLIKKDLSLKNFRKF